jgi:hypothetical protein
MMNKREQLIAFMRDYHNDNVSRKFDFSKAYSPMHIYKLHYSSPQYHLVICVAILTSRGCCSSWVIAESTGFGAILMSSVGVSTEVCKVCSNVATFVQNIMTTRGRAVGVGTWRINKHHV